MHFLFLYFSYEDERTDYKSQPPNNTIMVRGLAQHITENDVSLFFYRFQVF